MSFDDLVKDGEIITMLRWRAQRLTYGSLIDWESAVQETLLRVFRRDRTKRILHYMERLKAKAYVLTTLNNVIASEFRKQGREVPLDERLHPPASTLPQNELEGEEMQALLKTVIERLPPRYREVIRFYCRFFRAQGAPPTSRHVAAHFHIPLGSQAAPLLNRSLTRFRRELEAFGVHLYYFPPPVSRRRYSRRK